MKTEWLRNTIKDFEPYYVAPIAEKYVINANENYFNVLSIPAVKQELIEALDTFKPRFTPNPWPTAFGKLLRTISVPHRKISSAATAAMK